MNHDQCLDQADKVTMKDTLQFLREEYLTSVGPICKDNSPAHIDDVVNEEYKLQLKAPHYIGKRIKIEL